MGHPTLTQTKIKEIEGWIKHLKKCYDDAPFWRPFYKNRLWRAIRKHRKSIAKIKAASHVPGV